MSVTVTVVTACGAITFLIVRGDQLLSSHHTVTRNGFTAADEGGGQGRTANLLVPMIRRKELVYTAQHSGTCNNIYTAVVVSSAPPHNSFSHHNTTPSLTMVPNQL